MTYPTGSGTISASAPGYPSIPGQPTAAKREGSLTELEVQIGAYSDMVQKLYERLQQVLSPPPPQNSASDNGKSSERHIRNCLDHLRACNNRLSELIDRIDL